MRSTRFLFQRNCLETITVYVCESQPIVIEGLKRELEEHSDLQLVGASLSIADALDSIAAAQPNIILLDQAAGNKAAFELIPKIRMRSLHSHAILSLTSVTAFHPFPAPHTAMPRLLQ